VAKYHVKNLLALPENSISLYSVHKPYWPLIFYSSFLCDECFHSKKKKQTKIMQFLKNSIESTETNRMACRQYFGHVS
jgi:hypothetical protein